MTQFFNDKNFGWAQAQILPSSRFVCGFCNSTISSVKGYKLGHHSDGSGQQVGAIYLCPYCGGPTFFDMQGARHPTPALGNSVRAVPVDLNALYEEARRCSSQNCFTAAVLLCRKMLMNISVSQGAKEGLKFIEYVEFLSTNGYVPPNGKAWVDHIRKKGNEATHEIALMTEQDARELVSFVEMLLRFIFEFPSLVPTTP